MKTLKKFTTQEEFEENCEFKPYWDEINGKKTISYKVWDNRIGEEILCLTLPNTPERLKNNDFYGTPEWKKLEPEVIKTLYLSYSLLF